ncbi:hypothetical protein BP6252_02534 [Coleophoma cylindrospora]|uniref:G protein-coupled receptor GPR1/2/3 C-terminal domain-containing protein n=1 Tax=Coleophoma cylindrospora TaxID=1849047 RepID=A0A3D8SFN5_9HELO|nr:hypothetical protein BP6252_02534 [Coleophoma cylindrospora]
MALGWLSDTTVSSSSPSSKRQSRRMESISLVVDNSSSPQARRASVRLGGPSSQPRLKKMSLKMMMYPLVYVLIWIIPTSVRIYQASTGNKAPFWIGTIDKCCIVIQGLADALVYGSNESTLKLWRSLVRGEVSLDLRRGSVV